ncbi:MAG: 16S rRNA (guanine(527)-N(7))-methyltransferase RsmG [Acidobacteriota bacterium]|nr:16S rRNA (guanine(527)-N(7))-methyltransferase RsmG [Acidobacteriota bacterium]
MNNLRRLFTNALENNQKFFDVSLSEEKINALADYYELVQKHNYILHLVAPSSPEVFAVRHVLESLFAEKFLPKNARFADIGTGAGLPSIPCLIARKDLHGFLIESKLKKAKFLQEVLAECKFTSRVEIINRQFEELPKPDVSYVLCRALDKFTQKLPKLLKWSGDCNLLFFGGNTLRDELKKQGVEFEKKLLPLSEQRFLFVSSK